MCMPACWSPCLPFWNARRCHCMHDVPVDLDLDGHATALYQYVWTQIACPFCKLKLQSCLITCCWPPLVDSRILCLFKTAQLLWSVKCHESFWSLESCWPASVVTLRPRIWRKWTDRMAYGSLSGQWQDKNLNLMRLGMVDRKGGEMMQPMLRQPIHTSLMSSTRTSASQPGETWPCWTRPSSTMSLWRPSSTSSMPSMVQAQFLSSCQVLPHSYAFACAACSQIHLFSEIGCLT